MLGRPEAGMRCGDAVSERHSIRGTLEFTAHPLS